jgi:4-amino-4-deoxy-L-arabinose transferase-like glycosyltransferase
MFYGIIELMSEKIKTRKLKIILLILLYLSLPLFIFFTNPQNLPIPLLIMPVALLFAIIFVTVHLIITRKIKRSQVMSRTRLLIISGVIAIVPVILIVLASIGQFTLRDIILASVIVIIIAWYLLKVDFLST